MFPGRSQKARFRDGFIELLNTYFAHTNTPFNTYLKNRAGANLEQT